MMDHVVVLRGSVESTVSPIRVLALAIRRRQFRQVGGDVNFVNDGISRFDQRHVLIPRSRRSTTSSDLAFRPVTDAFEVVSHENLPDICALTHMITNTIAAERFRTNTCVTRPIAPRPSQQQGLAHVQC
jgi:hypothetical protein